MTSHALLTRPFELDLLVDFMSGNAPAPRESLFAADCVLDADGFVLFGSENVGRWLVREFVERGARLIEQASVIGSRSLAIDGYVLDRGDLQRCSIYVELNDRQVSRVCFAPPSIQS